MSDTKRKIGVYLPIAREERLVEFYDGAIEAYTKISYEEYMNRMYRSACRIAER